MKNEKTCCERQKEESGVARGMMFGLLPHTGCIAFILFGVLGVGAASAFFKPLLLNRHFFYVLLAMSFIFASISAAMYLKRHGVASLSGMKKRWKYMATLYGTTLAVNVLLFMVIFPLMANATFTGVTGTGSDAQTMRLWVDIPCPGHAPLITQELLSIKGVENVVFSLPNLFDVRYDPAKTSKENVLGLEVFKTYRAMVLDESHPKLYPS